MGKKHDFLSPKAIANRMKARGLQKLRWYCQLCQKQCRDENGFKCHQTSESHRRQLELFGQNPSKFIGQYSYQFEADFMAHMRLCHPTAQVSANKVYNEFIRDKNHVHMNSTRWLSLSGFVQYLGKKGLCKIEQGPKGSWFIQLIPKDDATDVKRAKRKQRDEAEKQDDIRQMKEIERQIKKATQRDAPITSNDELNITPNRNALKMSKNDIGVTFQNDNGVMTQNDIGVMMQNDVSLEGDRVRELVSFSVQRRRSEHGSVLVEGSNPKHRKLDAFDSNEDDETEQEEEEEEGINSLESPNGSPNWLRTGIVVKVLSPALKDHGYYKQKGVIRRVVDNFIAEIEMLTSGDIVQVDQAELETVLPAIGGKVVILTGIASGVIGEVQKLDIEKCLIQIRYHDHEDWFDYESVSKLHIRS
eukprot:g8387.t1